MEREQGLPGFRPMPSPDQVVREARPGPAVVGWSLDRSQRGEMLRHIPPRYANVVADHVTLAVRVSEDTPLPDAVSAIAVGHVDDGRGVEALVVSIEGETARPGGSTYHITWSLGPKRKARESNDVLSAQAWQPLPEPIPLALIPARWP